MVREGKSTNGGKSKKSQLPPKPSPVSNIEKIGSLNRYPDKDYARDLLHQIVKMVAPIIHENNFKVGTLCEMFPKSPNLLGLNVNRGQKILIRLRYHSNERSFLPVGDLVETFLHELTHNIYGKHDEKFYKFLDGLKKRFEAIQYGGVDSSYRCEEEVLGSKYDPIGGYVSIRDKRIKELSKAKYKSEARKLGGDTSNSRINKPSVNDPRAIRLLVLQAAERRLKDAKWCPSDVDISEVEPNDKDIDIIELDDEENISEIKRVPEKCSQEYKEVIDLTNEEYGEPSMEPSEIVVIDACEKETYSESEGKGKDEGKDKDNDNDNDNDLIESPIQYKAILAQPKSILRIDDDTTACDKDDKKVQFSGLLPSFDDDEKGKGTKKSGDNESEDEEIQYTFSLSPGRAFFGQEEVYPRRKLVADLNFDQIIKKGDKIEPRRHTAPSTNRRKKAYKKVNSSKRKNTAHKKTSSEANSLKKTVKPITFQDLL
ncbi:WLM domain-containing protein [Scheffersomyces amazonensis]|uniref:WLM domain-containing protein n=1 Tax=Scheffersomyces amazonensis TaxID=1078765 RepID=UPI00315CC652